MSAETNFILFGCDENTSKVRHMNTNFTIRIEDGANRFTHLTLSKHNLDSDELLVKFQSIVLWSPPQVTAFQSVQPQTTTKHNTITIVAAFSL